MSVIQFPTLPRRIPLPEDAIPVGKDRHACIFPMEGKWAIAEMDEGGGSLASGLTKQQAVERGLEIVMHYRGTLSIHNHNPDENQGVA